MKVRSREGNDIRRILAAMIMDTVVCSRIASQWNSEGLFEGAWANLIAGWCISHLRKFEEAPRKHITSIFEKWVESTSPADRLLNSIEDFLHYLDSEYDLAGLSSEYILSLAGEHFNRVRIRKEIMLAERDLDNGSTDEAIGRLHGMNRVELGVGSTIKLMEDFSAWRKAFNEERNRSLIYCPPNMDKFIGKYMTRGRFFSFMGPDKSGKSYLLLDMAFRGLRAKSKIAYFETGDLGEDATILRFAVRALRRPIQGGVVQIPVSVNRDLELVSKSRKITDPLTPQEAFHMFRRYSQARADCFRLSCHPNSSISINGIDSILSDWEREGWIPDIIIIDYADILAPPDGVRGDRLDQIDMTWKMMRKISQKRDCLLITATQSSSLAYRNNRGLMSPQFFSGRKTKLAEVNGMLGINATPGMQQEGICELNWVVSRDSPYSWKQSLVVAGNLALASPIIRDCL